MKKIILSIVVLTISIGALICLSFSKTQSFSSLCISEEDFDEICSNRKESNISLLNELNFNSYDLFFDATNKHYYYSLIENDNSAYDPKVEWYENNVNVSIKETSITNESIENNEVIEIVAYNNNSYSLYELSCTTLPLLNINTVFVYENINLTLFDNREGVKNRIINYHGDMHPRGGSTTAYPKLGYKLNIDKQFIGDNTKVSDISLLDLRNGTDYILYAGYNDQERIRNVFTMQMWWDACSKNNEFNLDNGMYYKYVELFFNNEYYGLYALGFPIDEIQEDLKDNEIIFKKNDWDDEGEFIVDYDGTGEILNFEVQRGLDNEDSWSFLRKYYDTLLNSNDVDEIYKHHDINNAIDIYLYFGIPIAQDSTSYKEFKDIFLTKKIINDDYKVLYAPWDMDITWGNKWEFENQNYLDEYHYGTDDIAHSVPLQYSPISVLLKLDKDNTAKLLKDRYNYLRNNEWSDENITNLINKYEKDVFDSGAFIRDANKWPESNQEEANIKLNKFKDFVIKRFHFVDEHFDDIYINVNN